MLGFLTLLLIVFSGLAMADPFPRHMIYVSSRGLGSHVTYEYFTPADSDFDEYNIFRGNVALNYANTIAPRFQLGGFLSHYSERRNFMLDDGRKGWVKQDLIHVGVTGTLNFSDDLFNAWYAGVGISWLNKEDEHSKEGTFDYLEDDRTSYIGELFFGKRFELKNFEINNITWSPLVSVSFANSGKDYDDDGLNRSYELILQIVRFDVLF